MNEWHAGLNRCILSGKSKFCVCCGISKHLRYEFPVDPHQDGPIDLTRIDDEPFYFNPFSGEMSLEFPQADHQCKGGILA